MSEILSGKERKRWARRRRAENCKGCLVYGLHAGDGIIRYIGQTRSHPDDRLRYHRKHCHQVKTPVQRWLAQHGDAVQLVVLCAEATWDVTEIIMIDRYKRSGGDLLNLTRGGEDTHLEARRCAGFEYPW